MCIPSGVSGSPAFLPGRSPNHFGRRAGNNLIQRFNITNKFLGE